MMLAIAAYWGLALPLGIILGLTDHIVPAMGEKGFWVGIVTGLTVAAIAMLIRLAVVIRRRNDSTMPQATATAS
ncbi:MATE family of MDR efflux pumps [Vibrio astriarenae]|nr:MATE family of MDR efflux pumps [Vibrio sp. C7]